MSGASHVAGELPNGSRATAIVRGEGALTFGQQCMTLINDWVKVHRTVAKYTRQYETTQHYLQSSGISIRAEKDLSPNVTTQVKFW